MFQFANYQYLYLLLIIPVMIGLFVRSQWKVKQREQRFGTPQLLHSLVSLRSTSRPVIKFVLMMLALTLCILMIARPQFGQSTGTEKRKGIEAVIMMDVSKSMLAEDVQPNRLERAKLLVATLINHMKEDKVGLGVFAGEAYPQLPITNDYVSAQLFLDNISTDMVSLQGTNLADAIRLANVSFTQEKGVGKAIIIITDGENHEEGAKEAAAEAAKDGRRVYMLGIGTQEGSVIPTPDGLMTDNAGDVVHTALNVAMCQEVAESGKGSYIHVDNSNIAQDQLLAELEKLQQADSFVMSDAMDEQFQAVGLLLLLILLVEMFMFDKQNPFYSRFKLFTKK